MYRHIWLCAFSLLVAMRLDAVTQRALPDGYTRRVWQTQDGLPENTVDAFALTPDHYLWIGTSGGLVRFDGARFVVFNRENTPAIRENSIFCLTVSRDGSLWAGTDGDGAFRSRGSDRVHYTKRNGLTNDFIRALRDVTIAQLEQNRGRLPKVVYKRCRHVITENNRVRTAALALQNGEIQSLSKLPADSHQSLRDDYEVSCAELDLMVNLASQQKGVYGARMTGGGFGGCTINLVGAENTSEFQRGVAKGYYSATGKQPDIHVCEASQGAEMLATPGEKSAAESATKISADV